MENDGVKSSVGDASAYVGMEARKAFEEANDTAIQQIIETLRNKNMTLNNALYLLGIVEMRIRQEARI